ncbi:MAG: pantetheine-phosphate adenylyltransferase [Phototrophicaceae bacterium]|jgi:pantetheine-phosphate adenylyltransferase
MLHRIALYPASLDPIHYGHIDVATRAAKLFDELIVAVYDTPKKKLLFSPEQRVALAEEAFKGYSNIRVALYSGLTVKYAEQVGAMALVRGLRVFSDFELEFRMGIANKQLAPAIETVAIMSDLRHIHISSTTVREVAELGGNVSEMVPRHVQDALERRFAELKGNLSSPNYTVSIVD